MTNHKTKTIIIGGISGGIGSALAKQLSDDGHQIVGFARDTQRLNALSKQLPAAALYPCDCTAPDALNTLFAEIGAQHPLIDAYVHAIGSILIKPAHLTSDADWLNTLHTNLSSAFYALRVATKHMSGQGHGSCLFFSSVAAQIGIANHEAIAAAKGGIEAMVRSAAATYASRGLRINAIAPSLTDTPLAQAMTQNPKMLEASKHMHPLGDISQATEIASLAQWMLSDAARLMTGQVIPLDGGLSTIVPKPKL
jgi:NAD(P)-dependent dehydrogenase (short-subunit alcohol dehydrogenase family)